MEKKRWVFIFSALCLALALTSSPVEAEVISKCNKDGDNYVKARPSSCLDLLLDETRDFIGIDCDDNSPDADGTGGEPCEGAAFQCETPNVRVGWADIEVSEPDQNRLCVPAMIQEQGTDGSYTCAVSNSVEDVVTFNLDMGTMKQIQKQGNDEVCSYFDGSLDYTGVGSFRPSRLYGNPV